MRTTSGISGYEFVQRREALRQRLAADPALVEQALHALFLRQMPQERLRGQAQYLNGVGFCKDTAPDGCRLGRVIRTHLMLYLEQGYDEKDVWGHLLPAKERARALEITQYHASQLMRMGDEARAKKAA